MTRVHGLSHQAAAAAPRKGTVLAHVTPKVRKPDEVIPLDDAELKEF